MVGFITKKNMLLKEPLVIYVSSLFLAMHFTGPRAITWNKADQTHGYKSKLKLDENTKL